MLIANKRVRFALKDEIVEFMELAERVDSIHAVEQEALDRLDTLAIAEAEIIDMGAEQKYKNELRN